MRPPKVFVSYSREGSAHDQWVVDLASLLRQNGVDASMDQWDLKAGQDVALFMESSIRDSDYVVLVCTPTYAEKSNAPHGGVGYEKNIISAEMLQAKDLRPKFIPVLRLGSFEASLPTYLGSRYGIDYREVRNQRDALEELLRALLEAPRPKPPLGQSPFESRGADRETPREPDVSATKLISANPDDATGIVEVDGRVESAEARALGRFEYLRDSKIDLEKGDPFSSGFWWASFALQGQLKKVRLTQFLEILRASKTGRTGWDVGWVPTREGIAAYPFNDGIEVWLAEDGGKEAGHSDFWRAEPIGTFTLVRGYQEDESDFKTRYPRIGLDLSLVLWRVSEVLLYAEQLARNIGVSEVHANLRIQWTGLDGRQLGFHKGFGDLVTHVCKQSSVLVERRITQVNQIKPSLVEHVSELTVPLFEAFGFFSISRESITAHLRGLIDVDEESGT